MICNKCKKKQGFFDRYCPECGTKLEHKKLTREETKKLKKYSLILIIIICLLFFGCRTVQYLRSPEYQALNYFKAIANNDVDKIYTYLNQKEGDFVSASILSEKMEVIGDIKDYQVTSIKQYQNDVIVSIRYTTSSGTNSVNIKMIKTNNFFQPYEVISGKIVENIEFKLPTGATLEIDGIDMSSYKKTEDSYDSYTISSMIKGTYHVKIVINDITVEDDVDVENNGVYTISNVKLEEELSVILLKRGNKQVELTEAGNRFYKRCLQILDLTEITKNELKQSYQDVLRIGITSSNSGLIQQESIQEFIKKNKHVQYAIHEGSTYEILDLLLSHNFDLGIVRTPFDTSQVNTFYLEKEPMIAIGKKEYFINTKRKIKDFKDTPLIILQRYLPLINDYCLNKLIQIQLKVTCDDSRTSLIWANSGIGVAICPMSSLALPYDHSLVYTILEDKNLYTGIAFITRKNEEVSALLNEFIERFK